MKPDSPVRFRPVSANRKLSPVDLVDVGGDRKRPVPRRPFCSSTFAAIHVTCPDRCKFKRGVDGEGNGCFADAGFTRISAQKMDAAAVAMTEADVIAHEFEAILRAFGGKTIPQDGGRHGTAGRDIRFHVGGDVQSIESAATLGAAAHDWRARMGGSAWTFTHSWPTIPRRAWGASMSVLASVESADEVPRAVRQGYAPALVVARFEDDQPFEVAGVKFIPCPAETRNRTCVECRLCLDVDLHKLGCGIAFAAHGNEAARVVDKLVPLSRLKRSAA